MTRIADRPALRARRLLPGLLLVLAYLALTALGAPSSRSAFVAKVSNSVDTAATAGYFTCTSAATGGRAYFAYPLSDRASSGRQAVDVSGNNRTGIYTSGGVTYGTTGPCRRDSGRAITLNGSSGSLTGAAQVNPQAFSSEIWFKTTVGGGRIIGFGNQDTITSNEYDRHIYLTDGGRLVFGVYPGELKLVQSSATYLDGKWHNAIATLAPASDPNRGIRLYVDGALVASDPSVVSAQVFNGYWRIGYDNLGSWGPTQPANFYFTGSLAHASVYTSVLTPAAVAAHYRAGT